MKSPVNDKIADAMTMAGMTSAQVQAVLNGAPIYGEQGMLDSLGLVRLISAVGAVFEDDGMDMFDMMQTLDAEAADTFADLAGIKSFLARIQASQLQGA